MQVSSESSSSNQVLRVLVMTTQTTLAVYLRLLLEGQDFVVDQPFELFSFIFELPIQRYDLILIGPSHDPDVDRQLWTEVRRRTVTPLILLTEDYQVDQRVQA